MKKFSVYCATLIITLIIWELFFSHFIYNIPQRYYRDDVVEWTPLPHETVVYSEEGYGWDQCNNVSALGPDITIPKKDNFRILVFGDSHTQAFQVMPGQKFTNLLGDRLNNLCRRLNKNYNVEVINMGVNGDSAADYIYYLDYYITRLKPDYLIFQVNHDDFLQALEKRPRYAFLEFTANGPVLQKDTSKENFLALLLDRYGLYNSFARLQGRFSTVDYMVKVILPNVLREVREFDPKNIISQQVTAGTPALAAGDTGQKNNKLLVGERLEQIDDDSQTLNKTTETANWFFSEIKKRNLPAAVLLLPYYPTTVNGTLETKSQLETDRLTAISSQTANYKLKVVNMQKDFLHFYETTRKFPRGFYNTPVGIGHLNVDGHRMTAERLFEKIGGDLP